MSRSHAKTRSAMLALPVAVAAAIATQAFTTQAFSAEPSWYAGGQGSAVFQDDADADGAANFSTSYDTGYGLGGIMGYQFANGFRTEAELGYQNSDIDNGEGHNSALYGLASGYYDFDLGQSWKPYLGGGIGYANVRLDGTPGANPAIDDSDDVPVWALAAGVGYDLNESTTLFAGYRYLAAFEDPSLTNAAGQGFDIDYATHNVQTGLRYKF